MCSTLRQLSCPTTNNSRRVPRVATLATFASARRPNKYTNDTAKAGGDISDAFASISGGTPAELPPRYAALKRDLVSTREAREDLVQTWADVLREVASLTATIRQKEGSIIPQVQYKSIADGALSREQINNILTVGTVIVKNAVPQEEALTWKARIQQYAKTNKDLATGFPAENPQVWEFYHSKSQIEARTHPAALATQKFLLKLWHASNSSEVDFNTPLTYFDRLRIRYPGDNKVVLGWSSHRRDPLFKEVEQMYSTGPHIDGGSVERWEDPTYRKCFSKLLTPSWREHDPFDATYRLDAIMDMYKGQGACNVFRPFQGWTSMSTTRANEGTLQVFPNIQIATAYLILRPFFKPIKSAPPEPVGNAAYLAQDNWVLDMDSPDFPNSVPGSAQELSDATHPHLDLNNTMTSLPLVEPGDQVYWHCDVIHAVERRNAGEGDSSVMYIPAVPLTVNNAEYLAAQRASFLAGYPPFDFSGGDGESRFIDRATKEDVYPDLIAQRAMGFAKFEAEVSADNGSAQESLVHKTNKWLFA